MSRLVCVARRDEKSGAPFFQPLDVDRSPRRDDQAPHRQRLGDEAVEVVVRGRRIKPDSNLRQVVRRRDAVEQVPDDVVPRPLHASPDLLDDSTNGRADEDADALAGICGRCNILLLDRLRDVCRRNVFQGRDRNRLRPQARPPHAGAVDVDDVGAALDELVLGGERDAIDPLALPLVLRSGTECDLSNAHGTEVHCRIKRLAQLAIGVYGGRADLHEALRERCPGFTFIAEGAERDACRVAVIDEDAAEAAPRKAIARIVLGGQQRKQGELALPRDAFLANPANFLAFAADLAEAAIHASHLEVECGYLTQIAELMAMTDASEVSERITRTVLNLLGLGRGTLFIHDPRLERYVVSFTNDDAVHDTGEFLPGIPQALLQRALSSGTSFAADGEAGMIVMPLQVEDDLVGVIKVPLAAGDAIDADAQANVSRYIGAVASVLGNIYQLTRSQDLAMRDDLTKAFNRRFFDSYLDEEIERSRRYGSLFSIIFLDLDELKTVNDFYGHLTGSRTLQEVAKRILAAVRGIDKVVRFGGDEFCIILPQTDQEQAAAVANRVRKAIISTPFRLDPDIEVSITASFGIATYPTHAVAKDDLVRQADQAMYRVKSTTKNAVGVATVEPATPPAAF